MYTDAGDEYQGKTFGLEFAVKATQATGEADGFGNTDYDKDAEFAWSGETDESGLEANTNEQAKTVSIDTPEQLAAFAAAVNAGTSYKGYTVTLQDDMNLDGKEWTPIGRPGKAFEGNFDGNGYTVSNLKISTPSVSDVGFFGFTTGGEIRNLKFENAQVEGYLDVGVVAGCPYTSTYTNIEVTGTVQVKGFSYAGGMFGKNAYNDLSNLVIDVSGDSYVKADSVEGIYEYRTYIGGVVGFMGEGNITVSNVVSNIDVYGSTCDVGGITGIAHYGNTFENCISSGDVYLLSAPSIAEGTEVGGIAGVWMNSSSGTVTLRNCSFTGSLHAALSDGTDITDQISGNTLTGSKYYPDSDAGQLIIE